MFFTGHALEGMRVIFTLPVSTYDDQPTFHAKYEDALHLMLPKMYLLFIFRLIMLNIVPENSIIHWRQYTDYAVQIKLVSRSNHEFMLGRPQAPCRSTCFLLALSSYARS